VGCGQPPGYELQWRIANHDATDDMLEQAPELIAVKQCSETGIFWVHVLTKQGDVTVWEDEFPCFSSAEAPPLEPGEYTLEVQGLRRNHEPWEFDPEAAVPRIAYYETSVTVVEGEVPVVDAYLRAPPGCDDGIDNDTDGTVDNQDPGCEVETADGFSESNDADLTLFQLEVTFLDSPAVEPDNVGVDGIRLEVVDDAFERTILSYELDLTQWPFRLPLQTAEFDGGQFQLLATAFGAGGDLTESQALEFDVREGEGTYVTGRFDFDTDMFLEPVVAPVVLTFDPSCSPGGALMLSSMRVRVVDENDMPVALTFTGNTFTGDPLMPSIPFESVYNVDTGWITFPCPSSWVTSTTPLMWGHHRAEVEARLAAVPCYESPLLDLAPQPFNAQTIDLERVMVGELPACPECFEDSQCPGQVCGPNGLCIDKEPGQ
jgi:hypothetical protein